VVHADIADAAELGPAITGRDAVVTVIGNRGRGPTTVQADTTASIVAAMRDTGTRRLVCVSSSGLSTTGDDPLTRVLVKPILRRVLRHGFADMRAMQEIVRASSLEWTMVVGSARHRSTQSARFARDPRNRLGQQLSPTMRPITTIVRDMRGTQSQTTTKP